MYHTKERPANVPLKPEREFDRLRREEIAVILYYRTQLFVLREICEDCTNPATRSMSARQLVKMLMGDESNPIFHSKDTQEAARRAKEFRLTL